MSTGISIIQYSVGFLDFCFVLNLSSLEYLPSEEPQSFQFLFKAVQMADVFWFLGYNNKHKNLSPSQSSDVYVSVENCSWELDKL